MAQRTRLAREDETDQYYRDKFNRGGHTSANDLKNLENQYADSSDASDMQDIEDYANDPANSSKNIDNVKDKEDRTPYQEWQNKYTGDKGNKANGRMKFNKRKGLLGVIGVGGIGGLLIAAFMAILPMKIEAMVQNISKKVDAVPEYAVKQRANYLVTHAIAVRMFQMANPGNDVVFCKSGTVGCSLMKTYTTKFIEDKYDLKMTKEGHSIKITPNGRTQLGGKATSWKIEVPDSPDIDLVTKDIESNKEMKSFVKDFVSEKIDDNGLKGTVKRYLARKILMKKYGITKWRGFEKTTTKAKDLKTTIKAKMIKNTLGRISQRMGLYFGCINGGSTETCAKTIDEIHGDSPDGDAAKEKYLGDAEPGEDETEKALSKFFSKQILSKAAGIAGLVMMGDMLLEAMANVDNGSLDIVAQDMVANVDTGYAFGDDTGVVTNAEKAMAGDGDLQVLGQLSQTLDGATNSPLMRVDNGINSTQFAAITGGASNSMSCNSSFSNNPQPIPKGQLVCNNQKFVRGYSTMIHNIPGLGAIFTFADYYVNSIPGKALHKVITTIGSITGWVINHTPGVSQLMKKVSGLFSGVLKALLSFIFDPPEAGVDAGGGNNYVALRGALTNSANQTMEQGVDDEGNAMGGGGTALTSTQVAAIQQAQANNTPKSQNSALASLFSPYVEGSLTQQFILTVPTQPSTMIASLLSLPSSLFSSLSPQPASAVSADVAQNPMGIIQYGYTANSSTFTANPDKYTESYCEKSADAREASLTMPDQMDHKYPVPVYTKSDPCALEKMAVGALLTSDGVTDNEYSLKDPVTDSSSYSGGDPTSNPGSGPSTIPTGSAQSLAKKILPYIKQGKLTCIFQKAGQPKCVDIQNTAKGIPVGGSCSVKALNPTLVGLILGLLQSGQTMQINTMCSNHPATSYGAGATVSMHNVGKAMDLGEVNGVRLWPKSKKAPAGEVKFYNALTKLVGSPDSSAHLVLNQGQCSGHQGLDMLDGYHVINTDYCHHQHLTVQDNYWSYSKKFIYPHSGIDAQPASKPGSYYGNA